MERCEYCYQKDNIMANLCESYHKEREKRQVCSEFVMHGMIMPYRQCDCNYSQKKCQQCRDSILFYIYFIFILTDSILMIR